MIKENKELRKRERERESEKIDGGKERDNR